MDNLNTVLNIGMQDYLMTSVDLTDTNYSQTVAQADLNSCYLNMRVNFTNLNFN